MFSKSGYVCTGNISEWAKCDYFVREPPRDPCEIPSWLKSHFTKTPLVVQNRALKIMPLNTAVINRPFQKDEVWQ